MQYCTTRPDLPVNYLDGGIGMKHWKNLIVVVGL